MLTIGDGLVSQIPALFISTAAGVLVTKDVGQAKPWASQPDVAQVSGRPKATLIAAVMMFAVGLHAEHAEASPSSCSRPC